MCIQKLLIIALLTCQISAYHKRGLWGTIAGLLYPIKNPDLPEDTVLNITQLVTKHGYNLEEHQVTTKDGFVLNVHRIPHGKHKDNKNGPVIFLMHGLMERSDSFVLQGPSRALAYILADEGFDVWMGNARGNHHSAKHINMTTDVLEFWNFSWEEIGLYDLPAMIDYALKTTNKENLYYVGYSQGSTTFYVMCSMLPEYNKKINMMFSLAPVAWFSNAKSKLIQTLLPVYEIIEYLLQDFTKYNTVMKWLERMPYVCNNQLTSCQTFFYDCVGYSDKVDPSFMPIILGHGSIASVLQLAHYAQLKLSNQFCRHDYGEQTNIEVYGTKTPPEYNLSEVVVPIMIYNGGEDTVSDPADVLILKEHLPNVYGHRYLSDFNHIDFMYAPEAADRIYNDIIELIRNNENNSNLI